MRLVDNDISDASITLIVIDNINNATIIVKKKK
jgi:hypothetical protein